MGSVPIGWISDKEFQSDLVRLGCSASAKQLSNWRAEGLLPSLAQEAEYRDDRVWGSTTWHAPIEARRALAVERALASKNRLEYAGAVLWLAGESLDERYWRPHLEKADAAVLKVRRVLQRLSRARDDDVSTLGERMISEGLLNGALAKMARRLPRQQVAAAINVGLAVASGEFEELDARKPSDDELSDLELTEQAMDLSAASADSVQGARLSLREQLSAVLADIARGIDDFSLADFSDEEIESARNDVRNGFKLAVCFYDAMSWIYGKQAFGLRMASALGRQASIEVYFIWIAIFVRLRRQSNGFSTSSEIAKLAFDAEQTWLVASHFRDLELNPNLSRTIGSKRWKLAFVDSHEMANLLKELAGCEFPKPEFRPWDQWKKLSKKTMSPGLLAMSIGATEALAFDELLGNIRDHATP